MYSFGSLAESPKTVLEPLAEISHRFGAISLAQRLEEIKVWLMDDLVILEQDIQQSSSAEGDLADRAASHLLHQPGKRIRPLCVVLAARIGGQEMSTDVRNLAVACELVHAATLLHDDVLDEGTERRGADASRVLYGNSASILGGDRLLIEALKRVQSTGQNELLSRLMDVIAVMVQAEAIQLERRGEFVPDSAQYMEIISGKTASIFEWGLRAGGVVGGLDEAAVSALSSFGMNLGMAFQMADDVLDLAGDPEVTGKNAFADLRDGKLTWPLIVACEEDPSIEPVLRAVARSPAALTGERSREIRDVIVATDCLEATRERARQFAAEAEAELAKLPESSATEALKAVVSVAINRGV